MSLPNVLADNNKDNNLSKYISVTYGESGGNYICSSDTNTQISNTNELNIGYHTITCTATGNNGTTASAVDNIIIARSDIIKSTANELVLTISTRYYKKTTSDIAIGSICTIKDGGSTWIGPTFVSSTVSGTNYNTSGNYTGNITAASSFEYLGKKWYVSPSAAWYPSSGISIVQTTLLNANTLKGVSVFDDQIACAKAMIDLSMSYNAILSTITSDATLTSSTYNATKVYDTKTTSGTYQYSFTSSGYYYYCCSCNPTHNASVCQGSSSQTNNIAGRSCSCTTKLNTYKYVCDSGDTLDSSTGICTKTQYSCPDGSTLNSNNNTCSKTEYTCPNGGTLSGTTCFR